MTLNTFHLAGRGEMNVTLGIPRLREILMVAAANIKTPSMDIPFLRGVSEAQATKLRIDLTRVTLAQVLQSVEVRERFESGSSARIYSLRFIFLRPSEYRDSFAVKPSSILRYFEKNFIRQRLLPALRKLLKAKRGPALLDGGKGKGRFGREGEEEDDEPKADLYQEAEKAGMGEDHQSSDEEPEVRMYLTSTPSSLKGLY
jgi:DNA-directed RNA polymerase I subunit RPA1